MAIISESGETWLSSAISNTVENSWDSVCSIVSKLRADNPGANPDVLATNLIEDRAKMAAIVGAGTGVIYAIPALGQLVAVGAVVPEVLYLAKVQVEISMAMTMLYNRTVTKMEMNSMVLTCFALAAGADFVKSYIINSIIALTKELVQKAILKMGEKELTKLLVNLSIKASTRSILGKIPLIAMPLNAGLNYGQIKVFGLAAKKFLSPTFVMCTNCANNITKYDRFCGSCGTKQFE